MPGFCGGIKVIINDRDEYGTVLALLLNVQLVEVTPAAPTVGDGTEPSRLPQT